MPICPKDGNIVPNPTESPRALCMGGLGGLWSQTLEPKPEVRGWLLNRKTIRKRRHELNRKNFPSETWFEKLLYEKGLGGYQRNYPLLNRFFGDFVWVKEKIVVEIDGSSHEGKESYDKRRDFALACEGYVVHRIRYHDMVLAKEILEKLPVYPRYKHAQRCSCPIKKHLPKKLSKRQKRLKNRAMRRANGVPRAQRTLDAFVEKVRTQDRNVAIVRKNGTEVRVLKWHQKK